MLIQCINRKHKVIKTAGIILLVVSAIAIAGWNYALPHYRPALKAGEVYGMDVSSHQQMLDWKKVSKDNISFVYIKASEGSGTQDPLFGKHWQGARQAGLLTGAYHYFSLCSPGKSQAQNFLSTVDTKKMMLPPALDLEFSPFCKNQPSRAKVIAEIKDYLNLVNAKSEKQTILYVGRHFNETYSIKSEFQGEKYWELKYLVRTDSPKVVIWQAGNFFYVDGVRGKVDLNIGQVNKL